MVAEDVTTMEEVQAVVLVAEEAQLLVVKAVLPHAEKAVLEATEAQLHAKADLEAVLLKEKVFRIAHHVKADLKELRDVRKASVIRHDLNVQEKAKVI